jgi:hypothetical protein
MRAILTYLGLVGVPFVALLGILRLGEQVHPARAAHGQYAVTFDSSGTGRCIFDLMQGGQQRLTVAQSGPRLELEWGRLSMTGFVVGDSLRAHAELREGTETSRASCLTADTLTLAAAIEKTQQAVRLSGEFLLPGCATCKPVPFRAERVAARHAGG